MSAFTWCRVLTVFICVCVLSSTERAACAEETPAPANTRETSLVLRDLGKSGSDAAHYITAADYEFRVVEFTGGSLTIHCIKRQLSVPWNENDYWYLTFKVPNGEQFALKEYEDDSFDTTVGAVVRVTRGPLWRHSEHADGGEFRGTFSVTQLNLDDQGQLSSIRIKFTERAPQVPFGLAVLPIVGELRLNADISQDPPNRPPNISAGLSQFLPGRDWNWTYLAGAVDDDLLPIGSPLSTSWQLVSGPGTAQFSNSTPKTMVSFTKPGAYVLRYTAFDGEYSVSSDVTIVIGSTAGTYQGYVSEENVVLGTFQVRILSSGRFTGLVKIGKERLPIRGERASFGDDLWGGLITFPGKRKLSLYIDRSLDGDKVQGSIDISTSPYRPRYLQVYGTPTSTDFLRISRQTSPFAAAYTWITEVPQDNLGPQGFSYGSAKVNRDGSARFVGRLSHGRAISYGGAIDMEGWLPIFWAHRQVEQFAAPVEFVIDGDKILLRASVQWMNFESKFAGFDDGFRFIAQLVGSRYTPPKSGTNLLTQTAEPVTVEAQSFTSSWPGVRNDEVTLWKKNSSTSGNGFTLKTDPRTGLFKGTLLDPDGKKHSFGGAILQHFQSGGGSFATKGHVGSVYIKPKEE